MTETKKSGNDGHDAQSLLERAIDTLRPRLLEPMTLNERLKGFWAAAVAVDGLATWNVAEEELMALARDIGLTRALGRSGEADIRHLIGCASRGEAPFA